jgi:hypothetical protein
VRFFLLLLMAIPLLGIGLVATAQPGDGDEEGDEGEGIDVQRRADLSAEEQLAEAQQTERRGLEISRRVSAMLDEARRENDIIRVTCLNDKLTQINANLRTLEARLQNLRDAIDAGDTGRRNHEFTVTTVLAQNFNVLENEANACIGQDIFETGATRVVTTIDPETPEEDPMNLAEPVTEVPFMPPPESPSM